MCNIELLLLSYLKNGLCHYSAKEVTVLWPYGKGSKSLCIYPTWPCARQKMQRTAKEKVD